MDLGRYFHRVFSLKHYLHLCYHSPGHLLTVLTIPSLGSYSRWMHQAEPWGFGSSPSYTSLTVGSLKAQKYTAESSSCEGEMTRLMERFTF